MVIFNFLIRQTKQFYEKFILILIGKNPKNLEKLQKLISRQLGKGYFTSIAVEVEYLCKLIDMFKPSEISVFFDIGAHVGEYTNELQKLKPQFHVYLFEPTPQSLKILRKKFLSHSFARIIPLALSNKKGSALLSQFPNLNQLNSILKQNYSHHNKYASSKISVKTITLDNFVSKFQVQPDVIKIDCEGSDWAVLNGGLRTIRKTKIVQFEFGESVMPARRYFRDFFNFFKGLNFDIYRITPLGLIPIREYSIDLESFYPTNYLCVNIALLINSEREKKAY